LYLKLPAKKCGWVEALGDDRVSLQKERLQVTISIGITLVGTRRRRLPLDAFHFIKEVAIVTSMLRGLVSRRGRTAALMEWDFNCLNFSQTD